MNLVDNYKNKIIGPLNEMEADGKPIELSGYKSTDI